MSGCYQPPYTPTVTSSAHIRESPKFLFPPRSTWIAFLIYPLLYSVRILTWNWSWENSNLCYLAQWNNRDSPRVLIGQKLMICYTEKPILYHDSCDEYLEKREQMSINASKTIFCIYKLMTLMWFPFTSTVRIHFWIFEVMFQLWKARGKEEKLLSIYMSKWLWLVDLAVHNLKWWPLDFVVYFRAQFDSQEI